MSSSSERAEALRVREADASKVALAPASHASTSLAGWTSECRRLLANRHLTVYTHESGEYIYANQCDEDLSNGRGRAWFFTSPELPTPTGRARRFRSWQAAAHALDETATEITH